MARATIVFGLLLCGATLVALLNISVGRITSAFIPIIFGIPIFICGIISLNPHRAKFWLRTAVAIAAIGAAGSILRMGNFVDDWFDGEQLYPIPVTITSGLLVALSTYALTFLRLMKR